MAALLIYFDEPEEPYVTFWLVRPAQLITPN